MNEQDLKKYKDKLSELNEEEERLRDLYLRQLANGELQGPGVGYSSIDKQWLGHHTEESIESILPECSMYELLVNNNSDNLDKLALGFYDENISYRQLITKIDAVATFLVNKLHVTKGEVLTIISPTSPEVVYLLYAASKLGITVNMVDPRTNENRIADYIKEVNSKKVFVFSSFADKLLNIEGIENIVTLSPSHALTKVPKLLYKLKERFGNRKTKKLNIDKWDDVVDYSDIDDSIKPAEFDKNRPVVMVHTGGTTGSPKCVLLSDYGLNAGAIQCKESGFDFKKEHTWLNIMPPFIAYGVGNGLHLPLICGMEVRIIQKFNPKELPKLIEKYKANHFTGVPTHFESIVENEKYDVSSLIDAIAGGDKMGAKLEEMTNEKMDINVSKGYGMTEVNAAVSATTDKAINKPGTVGLPFAKETVAVFQPGTDVELPTLEKGEICITGPTTMIGYYNNQSETNNILKKHSDGKIWVHTGDYGYIDNDGQLFIVDRIKRMITRHDGFKLFPDDIEKIISTVPGVKNCCVVGVPDTNYSQGKLAYAYVIPEDNIDSKDLNLLIEKTCKDKLPEYSQLSGIEYTNEFPLTPIGKIDYKQLEQYYIDNNQKKTI